MVQFVILLRVRQGLDEFCKFLFIVFFSLNYSYSQPLGATRESVDYDQGGEFNFVRVRFDTYYSGGFRGGPWAIDFPDADRNFLRGVSRLTNVRVMSDPIVLDLADKQIFDYPFLYMLEVGQGGGLLLSVNETENLREYLLRGGFLLIDDFWGQQQWDNFYSSFGQVFPEREIIELDPSHEIFHVYFSF